jgi:hypothetical protein
MARKTDWNSVIEHALGLLGLFLLGLIGWAVERLQGRSPIHAVLARLVLGCVTTVGWVIDRLLLPDAHRRDRDDSTKERALPSNSCDGGWCDCEVWEMADLVALLEATESQKAHSLT